MSLSFPELTKVTLTSVNPRAEHHGDQLVPAIDLRFTLNMNSAVLNLIHPGLREAFYQEPSQAGLLPPDELQNGDQLRFEKLSAPFAWKEEVPGCTLMIDYGLGGPSNVNLADCKLHKQSFDLQEGGTTKVGFTLSATHSLDAPAAGHLCLSIKKDMHITLSLPDAELPQAATTIDNSP